MIIVITGKILLESIDIIESRYYHIIVKSSHEYKWLNGGDFMNRVKEIRELTGLSQVKFASKYGIPKRTLESWESEDIEYKDYVIDWLEALVKNDLQKM